LRRLKPTSAKYQRQSYSKSRFLFLSRKQILVGVMGKRFTDTEKWSDPWFRGLPPTLKCVWSYICDRCDNAGVWKIDKQLAEFQIGAKIDWNKFDELFRERCTTISNEKLLIVGFIKFQFGELNENVNLHKNVLKLIEIHGMAYPYDTHTCMGTGIGKGKGKGIDNGEGELKEEFTPPEHLLDLWPDYLITRKQKKAAKTPTSLQRIVDKLSALAPDDLTLQHAILQKSIDSGWIDVFELKGAFNGTGKSGFQSNNRKVNEYDAVR